SATPGGRSAPSTGSAVSVAYSSSSAASTFSSRKEDDHVPRPRIRLPALGVVQRAPPASRALRRPAEGRAGRAGQRPRRQGPARARRGIARRHARGGAPAPPRRPAAGLDGTGRQNPPRPRRRRAGEGRGGDDRRQLLPAAAQPSAEGPLLPAPRAD